MANDGDELKLDQPRRSSTPHVLAMSLRIIMLGTLFKSVSKNREIILRLLIEKRSFSSLLPIALHYYKSLHIELAISPLYHHMMY